jgi:hypothetical protein
MIRTETLASTRNLDLLEDFIAAFPEVALDRAKTALNRDVTPQFINELAYYPGASKNALNSGQPFVWSLNKAANDRARRWYFANYPNGYTRTGAFGRGWSVVINEGVNNLTMTVRNPFKKAGYVVGSIRTGEGQIPGHQNTGWVKVKGTIDFWQEAAQETVIEAVGELVSRRP